MRIRDEVPDDFAIVSEVLTAAFNSPGEAGLVDRLRDEAAHLVSLVAESSGVIVGHILFSPVTIENADALLFGLAPMAVRPADQRSGIGSALVREGIARCVSLGAAGVIVLGHPDYYPRFGFVPASTFSISSTYDVPDEAFMALELSQGSLASIAGVARYHPVFDTL